jgi:hypothetical protein
MEPSNYERVPTANTNSTLGLDPVRTQTALANAVAEARRAAFEEAAKIAEVVGEKTGDGEGEFYIANEIASAIRDAGERG